MKNNKPSKSPELKIVPTSPANDLVTAPEHYLKDRTIDPICVIEDWDLTHHLACALKYICRAGRKGDEQLDLEKAIWYLNRRVEILTKK